MIARTFPTLRLALPILTLLLVWLAAPARAEVLVFDGLVVDATPGSHVLPLQVRAWDGREMIFWQSPQTRRGALDPHPGMPVRVRYTPDADPPNPGFGSALEVRLRAQPGSLLATLEEFMQFHPGPGDVTEGTSVAELQRRYPFLSKNFIKGRFFQEDGSFFRLYYDVFPLKEGKITSQTVTGNSARIVWLGMATGSELPDGKVATDIVYRMVREGGRWRVDQEVFKGFQR